MKKVMLFLIIIVFSFITFYGCDLSYQQESMLEPQNINNSVQSSSFIDASQTKTQEELLSRVSKAVVGISCTTNNYQSIGTGVCINEKSLILTNNHVIDQANTITLHLFDGETTRANLVWRDSTLDLAILQANKPIPYLKMVESGKYSPGEEVIAIGTPLALAFKHSATKGIISATNRTILVDNDYGESSLDNMIQHDASINPGNSGGPLINLKGEVVGINTVKVIDAEGMGFAIPVDTIHPLIKNINANGYYDTAYMGIFGYDANLQKIGSNKNGYYIVSVAKNSPAESLGLQKGDIITKIDNQSVENTIGLRGIVYSHQVGEKLLLEYERDGQVFLQYITLTKHPCCYSSQVQNI